MKKIYFILAIAFSIALFLLSPGMKAEAGDWISTPFFHDEHYQNYVSYKINSGSVDKVFSFTLPSREYVYVGFISSKSTSIQYCDSFNSLSGNGSSATLDYMINNVNFSGYYCYVSDRYPYDKLWPVNMTVDASNEHEAMGKICQKLADGEDPFYVAPTYTPDFSGLGYLKGLGKYYKEQTIASQSTNLFGIQRYVISDRKYIFGWDAESTSGVQLSDENISVNVKVQLFGNRSTLSGETVPIKCNGTIVDFGNVPASNFYYATSLAEFLVKFDFSDTNDLNGDKKPIFYFRLEKKNEDNTVTYGNTLKFDPSAPISYITDSLSSSPEGTITVGDLTDSGFVVDGSIESETVTGQGISGSSWEEVTINSNMNFVQDNSMITNIESFLSQIGSIPRIVGVLFSFLPSWCLGFVGLGLGMLVTVLVIKVVRG